MKLDSSDRAKAKAIALTVPVFVSLITPYLRYKRL